MTDPSPKQCTLCSLLCAETTSGHLPSIDSCPRWIQWTDSNQESLRIADSQLSVEQAAEQVHRLLSRADHALIWLDGADVLTTRAVVNLAKLHQAVIHIPTTLGQQHIRRVKAFDGWLGTTLAEMSEHSDLIITLGDRCIQRSPLLASRWIVSPNLLSSRLWWHISSQESLSDGSHAGQEFSSSTTCSYRRSNWSRDSWYKRWTILLQKLQKSVPSSEPDPMIGDNSDLSDQSDRDLDDLAEFIAGATNMTILWEVSELNRPEDEALVHRLFQLCQSVSSKSVCNLLALDSEAGSETARSTLMWLTGCQTTARFDGQDWSYPDYSHCFRPGDWQAAFDAILVVRALPSLEPLPNIQSQITLCASPAFGTLQHHSQVIPIATSGMDTEAFLLRGDHGMTLFSGRSVRGRLPVGSQQTSVGESGFPSAFDILQRALELNDRKEGTR